MKKLLKRQALLCSCYGFFLGWLHTIGVPLVGVYGTIIGKEQLFAPVVTLFTFYGIITFFFFCCLSWLGLGDIFEPKQLLKNTWQFYKDSWDPEKR